MLFLEVVLEEHGGGSAPHRQGSAIISRHGAGIGDQCTAIIAYVIFPQAVYKDVLFDIEQEIQQWMSTETLRVPSFMMCVDEAEG